ncbi:hypothetical protein RB653_007716 [Dictyostelium firmibasis]|uniref:Uncharacterized protein n=1 Tax=Dictyostelium firmibasis TaxID=79012 RepID=A0AAN7TMA3_9MYCE
MNLKLFILIYLFNYSISKKIDCSKVKCINPICGAYETLVILPNKCCGVCQPCPDRVPCPLMYRECEYGELPAGCCPCETTKQTL